MRSEPNRGATDSFGPSGELVSPEDARARRRVSSGYFLSGVAYSGALALALGYSFSGVHQPFVGYSPMGSNWAVWGFGFFCSFCAVSFLPRHPIWYAINSCALSILAAAILYLGITALPSVGGVFGGLMLFTVYTFGAPFWIIFGAFVWHTIACVGAAIGSGLALPQAVGLPTVVVTVFVGSLAIVSAVQTSAKQDKFQALCEDAGLVIHRRLDKAAGVLVDSTALGKYIHYGYTGPPNPAALLASGNMDFVEIPGAAGPSSRYARFNRPIGFIGVEESTADVVITMKTLTTDDEMEDGLFGEEMSIGTRSGDPLATFRYYWMTPRPVQMCPHPKQGIATSQIATYVVGLKEGLEQKWKDAFLP